MDLRQRTREIQFKRGLGPHADAEDFYAQLEIMNKKRNLEQDRAVDVEDKDDEKDDLNLTYHEQIAATKVTKSYQASMRNNIFTLKPFSLFAWLLGFLDRLLNLLRKIYNGFKLKILLKSSIVFLFYLI